MAQLGSSQHGKGLLWDHGKTQKAFGVLGSRLNFLAAQDSTSGFLLTKPARSPTQKLSQDFWSA